MKKYINNGNSNNCEISLKKIASIHEAGHAVIYHLYGHHISSIEIADNGSGIVNCITHRPSSVIYDDKSTIYERLDIYGLLCLSGYCAELKFLNRRIYGLIRIIQLNDFRENDISQLELEMTRINIITGNNFGNDIYMYLLQDQTKKLIRKPKIWEAILCLSDKLMKEETNFMNGEKAHNILNEFVLFGSKKSKHFL